MTPTLHQKMSELAELLTQNNKKLATAESCTGGGIAAACTDLAGSSAWFDCGFVTYSNESKQQLLDIPEATLHSAGAVSEAVVIAMVQGALKRSQADIAVAVSGIAGPGGGRPDKPVGTVWLAWGTAEQQHARCFLFSGDRQHVREQAILQSITELLTLTRSLFYPS